MMTHGSRHVGLDLDHEGGVDQGDLQSLPHPDSMPPDHDRPSVRPQDGRRKTATSADVAAKG